MNLSYASGTSTVPLLGITIGDQFDEIVKTYPDNEALIVHHQNIRWTYRQLQQAVNECARALVACGIKKGDRVGIWSPNRYEWAVMQFATAKAGVILVNINPSYRVHELAYALNQSGCVMIVTADKFKSSDYESMIHELAPELEQAAFGQLQSEKLPQLRAVVSLAEKPGRGMLSWEEFMQRSAEVSEADLSDIQRSLSFDDPINIQYTSGTTGYPKGATLSHHNILNNGYFVARTMEFSDQDRLIIPVPLYHCFGMVMGNLGCMTHGATMIYPSEGFEPLAVLQAAEKERATAIYGVPTMFIAMLEQSGFDDFDLTSLRTGIMAGSPCPIEVLKKVQSLMNMSEVQVAYGMTETSPVSTQTRMGTPLEKQVSTVGQIHPHLEVKIIDQETGQVVPIGVPDELCTRGYSVMLGYWDNIEQTREAIDAARWMHTGDLAVMDDEGYVNIAGRIKDMIIRGGENIYPREIEEFLYTHPAISDVQVIGLPDKKYGEVVMAWVKLKEGQKVTPESLRTFCEGKIAHFKVPAYFRFTEDFPMTVTGKIRKVEMRQISVKELELDQANRIETA
ncbi:AMP-binding protein [Flavilitoribacter nigricans]|uniref:AMP-binding protein n=1 Tax=Flavilitoribacter nigricans (strain ATCC 23147 / DSM 23189 / NBRC 102662 / NCIMB 1420 / SS-2) TaxID=1122177 RepID=A0A2D0NA72_FLAN2|nr:AMP-binding protein [Flavilitoribacter nigricans]PHN05385.1 AMP-binding protein [Flavilitoribacter nigricans DSM 23189 = NBRC 102662]